MIVIVSHPHFRYTLIIMIQKYYTPANAHTSPPLLTSKRAASHPLQPLYNGPGPLKWSLMEALRGGGIHSYSILQYHHRKWAKENAIAHRLFDSPGNCYGQRGWGLVVIQITPLPNVPSFCQSTLIQKKHTMTHQAICSGVDKCCLHIMPGQAEKIWIVWHLEVCFNCT